MARPIGDNEREIRDLVRRAEKNPDKTGTTRREALKQLIKLAHSPSSSLKRFAAGNIRIFFSDFPELEEDAINAVYDLCEDQDPQVRIDGYNAIVQISKEQRKWIKRNADVLVQLLQSDEPDEVVVVKRALCEHMDMDPRITLGVLCDQISPPSEPADDEEPDIKERLQSLVVYFLCGEAKRAIIRYTSPPGSESEEVLVGRLIAAIEWLSDEQVETIIRDLLLSLPCYGSGSSRSQDLLQTLLGKARTSLQDLRPTDPLSTKKFDFFLKLADFIAVERRVSTPAHLLRFYYASLTGKMVLQRFPKEYQVTLIARIANTFSACLDDNQRRPESCPPEEISLLRKLLLDACPILLEVLLETGTRNEEVWQTFKVLLGACRSRSQQEKWLPPPHLMAPIRKILTLTDRGDAPTSEGPVREVHDLSRFLTQDKNTSSPRPSISYNIQGAATSSDVRFSSEKKSAGRITNGHMKLQTASPKVGKDPMELPSAPPGPDLKKSEIALPLKRLLAAGDPPHSKKAKSSQSIDQSNGTPTLLRRMSTSTFSGKILEPPPRRGLEVQMLRDRATGHRTTEPDRDPVAGYSIKGAASTSRNEGPPPTPSSLLDRINQVDTDSPASRGRKRRKRGKAP